MRAVVQRVSSASVSVNQESIGQIQKGFLVLLGVERGDTDKDLHYIVEKVAGLRVFDDEEGRMNRSLVDTQGELLVVSQFTLLGTRAMANGLPLPSRPRLMRRNGFMKGQWSFFGKRASRPKRTVPGSYGSVPDQ